MDTTETQQTAQTAERIAQAFAQIRDGQMDTARATFADLMHQPQSAVDAHRGLAAIAWRQQQAEGALQLLSEAVRLAPDHADARADLALLLMLKGEPARAVEHWHARLEQRPDDAAAWHNYGKCLADAGQIDAASQAFERTLELQPRQVDTYAAYARALQKAQAMTRAGDVWRRMLAVAPKSSEAYQGLAETQFHRAELDACLETYRQGVAAVPDSPELHMGFGQMLEDFGDKAGAESEFRRALALRPQWAIAIEGLLTLIRGQASADDIELAKAVLADPQRQPQEHAMAGYGLGKVLDAQGDSDGAFAAWTAANTGRRQQAGPYKHDRLVERVDRLIRVFTPSLVADKRLVGLDDPRPVFVLGMPRSGTSLVEQMISSHPDAYGYGELSEIAEITKRLPGALGSIQRWPEVAGELTGEVAKAEANRYLQAMQAKHATTSARLIDKAPMNFFHIGLIAMLFPQARIIWCQRDPRDVCVSIFAENFGVQQRYATDLADIGRYYREYARLMRHWQSVLGGRLHAVVYEDLVADPESGARALIDAVGLPWDANCLRFYEHERPVLTPSRWQVRSPIYRGAVSRWQRYANHLQPLLDALGDEVPA